MRLSSLGTGSLAVLLAACSGSRDSSEPPWPIPSHFTLVSLNGQRLPALDTVAEMRVMAGTLELYHAESLRVVRTARDFWHDRLPCEALRVMAEAEGTVGLGAVIDTSTAGCDELRLAETDTQLVAYTYQDGRLHISDGDAQIQGDTITIHDEFRHVTVGGPTRISTRSFRYVRVATPAASREPQN
jgi:hypothetical protein